MKKFIAIILFLCFASMPLCADEREELTLALDKAVDNNDIAAARSLLEAGADANGIYSNSSDKRAFLTAAVSRGNIQLAELLLDYGADTELRSSWGASAVYYTGSREMLELLASRGARFDVTNNAGNSPLMYYTFDDHSAAANFALDWELKHSPGFTAGLSSRKDYYTELLSTLLTRFWNLEPELAFAKRLLDLGADPLARDENGTLILFLHRYTIQRNFPIIQLFIERGAPVNELYRDKTLLMYAADDSYRDSSTVDYLLQRKADPNQRNNAGKTALMFVRSEAAAASLLAAGADPNIQDNNGETALLHTWPSVQKLLLRHGADPSLKDNNGRTVLHRWYHSEDIILLDEFLSLGCPLDDPDINGRTPLWEAAYTYKHSYSKAITALLERGADPNVQDNNGVSAFYRYIESIPSIVAAGPEQADEVEATVAAFLAAGARPADMDNEGNSALRYVQSNYNYKKPAVKNIRNMVLNHANADEKRAARAVAAKEKREKSSKEFSENLPSIIGALSLPLLYGGLSVGMREGLYADNPSSNFMVPINSMFTLGISGLLAGDLAGLFTGLMLGADFGTFGLMVIGEVAGLIGGIIIGCLPSVQNAFANYPLLYYIPTALFAVTATIRIASGEPLHFPLLLLLLSNGRR